MRQVSWARRIALVAVIAAATTASAATIKGTGQVLFPGVNAEGNRDDALGAVGKVSIAYNTKKGTVRVIGRAVVQNLSNVAQTYDNVGALPDVGGEVVTDRLKVSKKGKAAYTGLIVGVLP